MNAISKKLNNEGSNLVLKFIQLNGDIRYFVFANVLELITENLFNVRDHSMKVNGRINWLHRLLVVGFGVKLEHLDSQLRYIFDLHI